MLYYHLRDIWQLEKSPRGIDHGELSWDIACNQFQFTKIRARNKLRIVFLIVIDLLSKGQLWTMVDAFYIDPLKTTPCSSLVCFLLSYHIIQSGMVMMNSGVTK